MHTHVQHKLPSLRELGLQGAILRTPEHKLSSNQKITPQDVIRAARKYVEAKTPLVNQGRNIFGLDCTGLPIRVALDLGLDVIDVSAYARTPPMNLLIKLLRTNGLQLVRDHSLLQHGDIVRFREAGRSHIGIVSDKYKPFSIIHVVDEGCIEGHLNLDEILAIYRHPVWSESDG